jgi:hypothetical protein
LEEEAAEGEAGDASEKRHQREDPASDGRGQSTFTGGYLRSAPIPKPLCHPLSEGHSPMTQM